MDKTKNNIRVRHFPELQDYTKIWLAMREFTKNRQLDTPDEIWLLQHQAVFTLGQAGKPEHVLDLKNIPLVKTDRGGQATYHGPGQVIIYLLLDIKKRGLGVRDLVTLLEKSLIALLSEYNIESYAKPKSPGVYVQKKIKEQKGNSEILVEHKIAALGLKVKKGCCYHGLSLNIDMDLTPFSQINPCGYEGLAITQLSDLLTHNPSPAQPEWKDVEKKLINQLQTRLSY